MNRKHFNRMTLEMMLPLAALLIVSLWPTRAAAQIGSPGKRNGKIVFTAYEDSGPAIFVMNADGSGRTRLTSGQGPAWSPNGKQIAFARWTSGTGAGEIIVMDADGGNQRSLVQSEFIDTYCHPAWSPDGAEIAFSDVLYSFLAATLYVINSDGSG